MSSVELLYLRQRRLDSLVIRAVCWSPWSHVALLLPDGKSLVDATFLHDVAVRDRAAVIASASKYAIREIACPDPLAAYKWALSQVGTPYDTWGVLGLGLHRDWQSEDAWWCSEFVEAALAAGGRTRFVNNPHRVTQQHSWMVA